jgi:hypothetical protein
MLKNVDMDADDAVNRSYQEVVGNNYRPVASGNANLLVPRKLGQNYIPDESAKIFDAYFAIHSRAAGMANLDIKAPDNRDFQEVVRKAGFVEKPLTGERVAVPGVTAKSVYAKQLERTGRWVTNSAMTGAVLMEVGVDGKLRPVGNTKGQKIEVQYKDIYFNPSKEVVDASESFLGGIFGY